MNHRLLLNQSWCWGLLLLGVGACKNTADGIEQDTKAATERAGEAKQALERDVGAFKSQAEAKLEQLTVAVHSLKDKAQDDLDGSRQKLEDQISETRQKLAQLKADGSSEWQKTKQDLEQRIAELGRQLNQTLDKAGGGLDRAGDKVEKALGADEKKAN
jgi:DNA anti-recombination protein RmuC